MFVTYPYRNNLSTYTAGFVDTERREGPESLATVPISVARPGRGAGGRRAAGPALGTSRMQFTNTSDATLQTDTNQHNAGGELHATLLNNEPYQHTRPHPMGGRRGADQRCKASPRDPEGPTAPGTQVTPQPTKPKARVWRSRGRAAAYGRTKQPGPATPTPPAPGKQPGHRATSTTMGAQAAAHGRTTQPGPARPPTGVNDQTIR